MGEEPTTDGGFWVERAGPDLWRLHDGAVEIGYLRHTESGSAVFSRWGVRHIELYPEHGRLGAATCAGDVVYGPANWP